MEETVLGFVPLVVIDRFGLGTRNRALLVTSERMVLIPWDVAQPILGGLLDSGILQTKGTSRPESVFNPDRWAGTEGSATIPHGVIRSLACRRTVNTYRFSLEFVDQTGRGRRLRGFVLPSRQFLRKKKEEGVRPATTAFEYARAMETLFRKTAIQPPALSWQL